MLARFIEECATQEEAFAKAAAYTPNDTISSDWLESVGCGKQQQYAIRRNLSGDVEATRRIIKEIYTDSPTEFHGTTYPSVAAACAELGLDLKRVRARMASLLSFQDVVHELYYVYNNKPYRRYQELGHALGFSRQSYEKYIFGVSSHDEVVREILAHGKQSSMEAVPLSISKSNAQISGVVNLRDGTYMVYCACCGRPIRCTEDEARRFKHSDACEIMEHQGLKGVTKDQLSEQIRRKGTFKAAMEAYAEAPRSTFVFKINRRKDVAAARSVLSNKCLVTCAVCGKTSLLTDEEAFDFTHSQLCDSREWQYAEVVDKRGSVLPTLFNIKNNHQ